MWSIITFIFRQLIFIICHLDFILIVSLLFVPPKHKPEEFVGEFLPEVSHAAKVYKKCAFKVVPRDSYIFFRGGYRRRETVTINAKILAGILANNNANVGYHTFNGSYLPSVPILSHFDSVDQL